MMNMLFAAEVDELWNAFKAVDNEIHFWVIA